MWDNLEKLTCGTSKTARFALETHRTFLEILPAYPLKSFNLFNLAPKGEVAPTGGAFFSGGMGGGGV